MRSLLLLFLSAVATANAFGAIVANPAACPACPTCAECEMCPALLDSLSATNDVALLQMSYSAGASAFMEYLKEAKPIGYHTALLAEASDAGTNAAFIVDGHSGDTAFPHGHLKALATVGEYSPGNGKFHVGVPDGQGAYLLNDETVRIIVQSESYGPVSSFESFPWPVNGGAGSFTGSHVQYIDVDREMLSTFMTHKHSAEAMVKGAGNVIDTLYNLKGELVGARSSSGPTASGAHFSNTDAAGNYVIARSTAGYPLQAPTYADWLMQSLCSAHLESKHQWGPGIGVEDDMFVTNEEWITVVPGSNFTGLPAHIVDLATHTSYATGVFTLGGFEKVVEFSSGSAQYVAFAVSGYNGDFGSYDSIIALRNAMYGPRADGKPWVRPQNIVPSRIYIGIKGLNSKGQPANDYLSHSGLRYGQLYGFASASPVWRDPWHKDPSRVNGDQVTGGFYPIAWRWDGEVRSAPPFRAAQVRARR
jgi:hypothetical protein